jgi:hypothetical protein
MMIEVTGDPILKLTGRRREIVAAGPSPGRMPTTVPRRQPIRAKSRLVELKAIPNPMNNPLNIPKISSILAPLYYRPRNPGGSGTSRKRLKIR